MIRSAISHAVRHARCVATMKHIPTHGTPFSNQPWRNIWRPVLARRPSITPPTPLLARSSGGGGSTGGIGGGHSGGRGGGGEGGSMGGPAGLWALYLSLLETKPVSIWTRTHSGPCPCTPSPQFVTKSITAGLLNMLGDILAQVCIEHNAAHDWHRTLVLTVVVRVLDTCNASAVCLTLFVVVPYGAAHMHVCVCTVYI